MDTALADDFQRNTTRTICDETIPVYVRIIIEDVPNLPPTADHRGRPRRRWPGRTLHRGVLDEFAAQWFEYLGGVYVG